jgi:hypothetical protein
MTLRTRRGAMAHIGSVLIAATLLVGVSACSSDDEPTDPVENEVEDEVDEVENEVDEELDEIEGEIDEELDKEL